ncbi:MAG TPA: hypothetical protein VGA80_04155 [Flavobacteriaceae bacterium]|jgi:hypothetical protein
MKKEVKKGILMVTMLSAMISYATGSATFEKKVETENSTLSIHNVKQGQQLVIKDYNGIVLYKELIEKSGAYTKGFDLTTLPNGEYYFELDKDIEVQVIPFKVYLNKVEFLKDKETKFFKPVIRFKENKVLLSRLSFDNKPLEVKIYYDYDNGFSDYELIHSEKFKDTKIVERVYALDKTKKGNYRVVVKTEGREFTESITI